MNLAPPTSEIERDAATRRSWRAKFGCAFRGLIHGVRTQTSFAIHVAVAVVVIVLAGLLRCSYVEWGLLLLCIAGVLTCEMINTAIERLAKAITLEHDPHIRDALDMASAAVLLAAMGSAVIGAVIFIGRLVALFCSGR